MFFRRLAINYSLWPQALGGSNLKYNAKKLLSREVRHASLASTSLSRIEKIVACRAHHDPAPTQGSSTGPGRC